jgi:flagellin
MAVRINFNSAAIRSHFNLNTVDRQLSTSLERLSSGVRIRRAADAPGDLILANQLRHHLVGLSQASDNVSEGVSMLQVAESGMDSASNLLNRARELLIGALNDGVNDPTALAAYQEEYDSLMTSLDHLATSTRFGNRALLDGTLSDNRLTSSARQVYSALTHDDTRLPRGIERDSTLTIQPPSGDLQRAEAAVTLGGGTPPALDDVLTGQLQDGVALGSLAGETLTLSGPLGSFGIPLSDTLTVRQLVGAVNAASEQTGLRAGYDTATGGLQIESLHFGGGAFDVQMSNVNAGAIGLLDDAPGAAGNGLVVDAPIRTVDVSYVDEQGITQHLTLVQDPHVDEGRGFISTAGRVAQSFDGAPAGDQLLLAQTSGGLGFTSLVGETLSLTGSRGNAAIALDDTMTINDLVNAINDETETTGLIARYQNGELLVRQEVPDSGAFDVQMSDLNTNALGLLDDAPGLPGNGLIDLLTTDPNDFAFRLEVRDTSDGGLDSSIAAPTVVHTATRASTTAIQIGALSGQIRLVEAPDIRSAALGHSGRVNASGIDDLREIVDRRLLAEGTIEEREDALRMIDAAINEISASRGEIGALISSGLESTLDTLAIAYESLTSSESLLRDTDFALESANFARHNIVFQAATSMLAQANQIPQSLLQLLG